MNRLIKMAKSYVDFCAYAGIRANKTTYLRRPDSREEKWHKEGETIGIYRVPNTQRWQVSFGDTFIYLPEERIEIQVSCSTSECIEKVVKDAETYLSYLYKGFYEDWCSNREKKADSGLKVIEDLIFNLAKRIDRIERKLENY